MRAVYYFFLLPDLEEERAGFAGEGTVRCFLSANQMRYTSGRTPRVLMMRIATNQYF